MAKTELGKALQKLVEKGESLIKAAKELKDAVEDVKNTGIPPEKEEK